MSVLKKNNDLVKRIAKQSKKKQRHNMNPSRIYQFFQRNKRLRPVLIAISSSLIIGVTFGFIFLSMVKQEEGQTVDVLNSSTPVTNNLEKGNKTSAELESVPFYVVQAGVFSDEKNANDFGQSLATLPYISWERDGQFYVFTGIASTESEAKKLAATMDKQDIEVYVKEWGVDSNNIELLKEDVQFIDKFIDLWKQSLAKVSEGEKIARNDWESLLNENVVSEQLRPLIDKVEKGIKETSNDEILLLNLIYEYEKILSN